LLHLPLLLQLNVVLLLDSTNNAAVTFMDFSACNDYLASVYESGIINIFGLKTGIKFHTINLDRNSIIAKFHPKKRFLLAIGSIKGAVTVYDICSKKIHFQQKDAHDAKCFDVAFVEENNDRLYSCGYDKIVKIFDMRNKTVGLQIKSACPFSTIDASKCGSYFAVGNLRGDVISYDMRNLKAPLASVRVSDKAINRLMFVPAVEGGMSDTMSDTSRQSVESKLSDCVDDQLPEPDDNISFMDDIIDFHKGRVSDFATAHGSRVSTVSNASRQSTRLSDNFGRNALKALNDLSFDDLDLENESFQSAQQTVDETFINQERLKKRSSKKEEPKNPRRRSSLMQPNMNPINEETSAQFNKENINFESPNHDDTLQSNSTTPAAPKKTATKKKIVAVPEIFVAHSPPNEVDVVEKEQEEVVPSQSEASLEAMPLTNMQPLLEALRQNIRNDVNMEIQSLDMDLNHRHLQTLFQMAQHRRELMDRIKMIEECVGMLMQDDPLIRANLELQEENRQLRNQLNDVVQRLGH